jgi:hypothetical protein
MELTTTLPIQGCNSWPLFQIPRLRGRQRNLGDLWRASMLRLRYRLLTYPRSGRNLFPLDTLNNDALKSIGMMMLPLEPVLILGRV